MSVHVIYYKDGAKMMRPILSRECYLKLRGSKKQKNILAAVRGGDEEKKTKLLQMNYSCLPNEDGTLKGSMRMSNSVGMDIDHIAAEEMEAVKERILAKKDELGLLMLERSARGQGYHLVFRRKAELSQEENLRWASELLGVEFDGGAKDITRVFFTTTDGEEELIYLDDEIFGLTPQPPLLRVEGEQKAIDCGRITRKRGDEPDDGLTFKGIALSKIAKEWLEMTGGEPVEGERNSRLFDCARVMRHITDFDEGKLLAVMPSYGLPEEEMRSLIHSACNAVRGGRPKELDEVLKRLDTSTDDNTAIDVAPAPSNELPPLPPLLREMVKTFPEDFKKAAALSMLSPLGALGSRLSAEYIDGKMHTPSFHVSFEAPQANGKSLITEAAKWLLEDIASRDEQIRQQEIAYSEKAAEAKLKDKKAALGSRPKGIVRIVPATISVTKLLMRLNNSQGLHLICIAPEVDEVTQAIKREFANYSSLLRVAFDNDVYGQDYASDNSFSGLVNVYFNTLFCGTPKAMRKLYPDVENGLVSRVLFVTVPDQFGKPMPVRSKMSDKDEEEVRRQIARLDGVSFAGGCVQTEHVMDMTFLNRVMDSWIEAQRAEAVRTNDRTRDTFCRRAAVVGFRAGMLAWFLYGEKDTRNNRYRTAEFAHWVADQMLTQHLLRFQIDSTGSNTNRWVDAYNMLGEEFTREEVQKAIYASGNTTPVKKVISLWLLGGCIKSTEVATGAGGNRQTVRFRKVNG